MHDADMEKFPSEFGGVPGPMAEAPVIVSLLVLVSWSKFGDVRGWADSTPQLPLARTRIPVAIHFKKSQLVMLRRNYIGGLSSCAEYLNAGCSRLGLLVNTPSRGPEPTASLL
jgi:hypothetical protein